MCSLVRGPELVGRRGPSMAGERSATMAYCVVHRVPGGTKEQYEASIAAVHPSDGSLPEGQIFHVAGPSGDDWTIVAIHDSQESWERFRDETLMPTKIGRASCRERGEI